VSHVTALAMQWAVRSDVGRRANNEDSVFASTRVAAVADGVGGAAAGEVASRTVIDAIANFDKRRLVRSLEEEFREAINSANDALALVIAARPELSGMGTTLTAVAMTNDGRYLIANVGDSRTYLWRDGELRQLTHDASLVQELLDRGAITEAEARHHPQRSVVLDALDGAPRGEVTLIDLEATFGDRLLLCSDGLSDVAPDSAIAAALRQSSREQAADGLVDLALSAGSKDNISVLIADVVARDAASAGWLPMLEQA
jgi:serine/threonine protein phosphatase PrpC